MALAVPATAQAERLPTLTKTEAFRASCLVGPDADHQRHARRIRQAGIDISFADARARRGRRRARRASSPPASGPAGPPLQSSSADDALRRAVDAVRAERTRLELRLGELEAEAADVRQAIAKLAAMTGEP